MILLINMFPRYCPWCGTKINIAEESDGCILCECGCGMQKTDVDTVLNVSDEIGGSLQYLDLSEDLE